MKKDLQLRYGFSVAIFYLSTVHFSMLNRQFFSDQERPGKGNSATMVLRKLGTAFSR